MKYQLGDYKMKHSRNQTYSNGKWDGGQLWWFGYMLEPQETHSPAGHKIPVLKRETRFKLIKETIAAQLKYS